MSNAQPGGIMSEFKSYKKPLVTGAVGVVFGLLSKSVAKKEIVPVSNFSNAFISFLTITVTSIVADELVDKRYI